MLIYLIVKPVSNYRFLYLDETFTPVQLAGAFVTVAAIYMVNYKTGAE